MLIGPNGTGKSTIVAAIILGLGGSPKTVGRGKNISEYVKHNEEKATIKLLMQGKNGQKNFTVTRHFDKLNASSWELNGEAKSQKDVLTFISKYQIQVDNLCQFLPQDRVADFAKLNKQQLLKETQLALCRDDLVEKQEKLKMEYEQQKQDIMRLDKSKQKLQELKDINVSVEAKVRTFNKRKKALQHLDSIKRKEKWLLHFHSKNEYVRVKDLQNKSKDVLNTKKEAMIPLEEQVSEQKEKLREIENKKRNIENSLKRDELQVHQSNEKVNNLKNSLSRIKDEKSNHLNEMDEKKKEIDGAQLRMKQLNNDKAEVLVILGGEEVMNNKMLSLNNDIKSYTNNVNTIRDKIQELTELKDRKKNIYKNMHVELGKLENVKNQRLESLHRLDQDAYKGTLWLRDNKHLFKGEVYEPMILELNVLEPKNALYVERSISLKDKVAFVCTEVEDMNLLIRHLRMSQKLSVNVLHSSIDRSNSQMEAPIPIEHLTRYGFHSYVISLFSAPDVIKKYLCKTYHLHSIPVGENISNFNALPKQITTFFSGTSRISISYSRYTGEKSTRQNEIKSDGTFSITLNLQKKDLLENQMGQTKKQCDDFAVQIQKLEEKINDVNHQINRIKESQHKLRTQKQQVENIDGKIRILEGKLKELQKNTKTKEEIEQMYQHKINQLKGTLFSILDELKDGYKSYMQQLVEYKISGLSVTVCRKDVAWLEEQMIDMRNAVAEALENFRTLKKDSEILLRKSEEALVIAKQASNGWHVDDEEFNEFRDDYDKLSNDLEALHEERETLESKLDCMINSADDIEMQEYEARVSAIEKLEANVEIDLRKVQNTDERLATMENEWLEPLNYLIGQINERFSSAFEHMGCSGEVSLYKGENGNDYEKYGISIKVTYRDGEPLQELNTVTQSGGERAVATATYMLSLQELTSVPFRCVDEINQGMDVDNERRIFNLLVDITSQPGTSQYFLITPKLIPKLKFVESMKIHFVHNGPFVCEQNQWNKVQPQLV